ncbi:MAG: hypothetical protein R3B47_16995 [Bacteroidia bacterium]
MFQFPDLTAKSKRYGIPLSLEATVEALRKQGQKVILAYFGSPYGLGMLQAGNFTGL